LIPDVHGIAWAAFACALAPALAAGQFSVRRLLDPIGAAVALVLLFPLLLAIAGAIKATSDGPVLVRCGRSGGDRSAFGIYEFRTTAQVPSTPGPSRVTAVGRFLRKYNFHELPQLINVVSGEMSLTGPRSGSRGAEVPRSRT
jgi:polysaccharide biosynthesis protein PslA